MTRFDNGTVVRCCRSFLAENALLEWADGGLSARAMIQMVRSGQRDGLQIQMVENIASLGSDSLHNSQRDLGKLLEQVGVLDHITQNGGDVFQWRIPPNEII